MRENMLKTHTDLYRVFQVTLKSLTNFGRRKVRCPMKMRSDRRSWMSRPKFAARWMQMGAQTERKQWLKRRPDVKRRIKQVWASFPVAHT